MIVFLVILLCIQIIVESLPVSSSGHILLFEKICTVLGYPNALASLHVAFDTIIPFPNILIIIIFFIPVWSPLLWSLLQGLKIKIRYRDSYQQFFNIVMRLVFYASVSVVITGFFYLFFKITMYGVCLFSSDYLLLIGFCITSVLLFSLRCVPHECVPHECAPHRSCKSLTLQKSIILGCAQGLALLPGISRLAITYTTARFMGLTPRRSFQTSFMIAIPVMIAGFAKDFFMLLKNGDRGLVQLLTMPVISIILIASIFSYCLMGYVRYLAYRRSFWKFGWYMFVPIILMIILCF